MYVGLVPRMNRRRQVNKERRAELASIREEIDRAQAIIDEAMSRLETVKDEEQDYYDNMPESFQNGEKGERVQQAVDALDNAYSELDTIDFDGIMSSIDEAAE
jgi:multidrug resistance efflux pump